MIHIIMIIVMILTSLSVKTIFPTIIISLLSMIVCCHSRKCLHRHDTDSIILHVISQVNTMHGTLIEIIFIALGTINIAANVVTDISCIPVGARHHSAFEMQQINVHTI